MYESVIHKPVADAVEENEQKHERKAHALVGVSEDADLRLAFERGRARALQRGGKRPMFERD